MFISILVILLIFYIARKLGKSELPNLIKMLVLGVTIAVTLFLLIIVGILLFPING